MELELLKKTTYKNGEIISDLIKCLVNKYQYKNILFIRTPTTGEWLDYLLTENETVIRILYDTTTLKRYKYHKSTIKIKYDNLHETIMSFNKNFDLICMDIFHLYENSINDINMVSTFLSDSGLIVLHDCFPDNKSLASPKFKMYNWCGETYLAFIEFAYNHPEYFYGLIKMDTGIGIISKKFIGPLKNNFNKEKQKMLLSHKDNNPYDYFIENQNDLMNIIVL